MFNLWGKIRLDGAEAKKDAKSVGAAMGNMMGQQFRSGMLRFISAGALISMFRSQMQAAVAISQGAGQRGVSVETFQELTKVADKLGITVEELQKLAPFMPNFEKLMNAARGEGGIMNKDTINALTESARQVEQAKIAASPATTEAAKLTASILTGASEASGAWRAFFGLFHPATFSTGVMELERAQSKTMAPYKWFTDMNSPAVQIQAVQVDLTRQLLEVAKKAHADYVKGLKAVEDKLSPE